MELTHDDVVKILDVLNTADVEYFELQTGDSRIVADRTGRHTAGRGSEATVAGGPASPTVLDHTVTGSGHEPMGAAPEQPTPPAASAAGDVTEVTAPVVGLFYGAPRPGAPPYVEVGSVVEAGATVGLLEVMKMFTSVTAPLTGTVTEILVANGEFVEFGQPLLRLRAEVAA
ncbi:MAG: acetyl-CoA carboxylase biotin carboxyl carrier protein subunit [Blastococcus sp.]|jgi:acetyl-CoA carboxylase biotin carboxyl carrier protein|nr:acetyl-CoA carboxylase biotin carboxyl carrier protein subunit [Blastococcus sp.]